MNPRSSIVFLAALTIQHILFLGAAQAVLARKELLCIKIFCTSSFLR